MQNSTYIFYRRNDFKLQNEQISNLRKNSVLRATKYKKVYKFLGEINFTPKKSTLKNIMDQANKA